MKLVFSVVKKLTLLLVFVAACSTAASPWQRIVVAGIGLVYVTLVSIGTLLLGQIAVVRLSNKRRFVELRRLAGHPSPLEQEEEDDDLAKVKEAMASNEQLLHLLYVSAFLLVVVVEILIALFS